jgi:hypothetical protein
MTTVAIDQGADRRGDEPGDEQARGKSAHRKGQRESALLRDQRNGQHRRIEDRSPGEDLRDAEDRDGTPGPGNEFAERRHCYPIRLAQAETCLLSRSEIALRGSAPSPVAISA